MIVKDPKDFGNMGLIGISVNKLIPEQVEEIRIFLSQGKTQAAISKKYGISQPMVSRINLEKSHAIKHGKKF